MRGELRRNPQNRPGWLPSQLSLPPDLGLHFQAGLVVMGRGSRRWPVTRASPSSLLPPATAGRLAEEVPELTAAGAKLPRSNGESPVNMQTPPPGGGRASSFCFPQEPHSQGLAGLHLYTTEKSQGLTHWFSQEAHIFFTFKEFRGW